MIKILLYLSGYKIEARRVSTYLCVRVRYGGRRLRADGARGDGDPCERHERLRARAEPGGRERGAGAAPPAPRRAPPRARAPTRPAAGALPASASRLQPCDPCDILFINRLYK